LLLFAFRFFLLFVSHMMAHRTTRSRTGNAVMRHVTRDTADNGTFNTSFRLNLRGYRQQYAGGEYNEREFTHGNFSL
jgi:hypothetical protein